MRKIFVVLSLCAFAGVGSLIFAQAQDTSSGEIIGTAEESVRSIVDGAPAEEAIPEEVIAEEAAPEEAISEEVITEEAIAEEVAPEEAIAEEPATEACRYSMGVLVGPVPDIVAAQLPESYANGLFVTMVYPKSAAAKAGLKPYDIIVALDGNTVSADQLQKAVADCGGKEMTLAVIRAGQKMDLKVTPEAKSFRPQNQWAPQPGWGFQGQPMVPQQQVPQQQVPQQNFQDDPWFNADPNNLNVEGMMEQQRRMMENMQQRIEAIEKSFPGFQGQITPPRFHRNHFQFNQPRVPQMQMPQMQMPQMQMPQPGAPSQGQNNSFSVQIQKFNDQPAKIKINDNGNQYEATEDDLDKLPEDVRNKFKFDNSIQFNMNMGNADEDLDEDLDEESEDAEPAVPQDEQSFNGQFQGVLVNLR